MNQRFGAAAVGLAALFLAGCASTPVPTEDSAPDVAAAVAAYSAPDAAYTKDNVFLTLELPASVADGAAVVASLTVENRGAEPVFLTASGPSGPPTASFLLVTTSGHEEVISTGAFAGDPADHLLVAPGATATYSIPWPYAPGIGIYQVFASPFADLGSPEGARFGLSNSVRLEVEWPQ
jgi:hypothetical protein